MIYRKEAKKGRPGLHPERPKRKHPTQQGAVRSPIIADKYKKVNYKGEKNNVRKY